MKNTLKTIFLVTIIALFTPLTFAADGDLDTTFGSKGYRITPMGDSNEIIYDVASLSNGKTIAVGSTEVNGINRFLVARYNVNGTLDTTFGDSLGFVTTVFQNSNNDYDCVAHSVDIQSDGKIVVAGIGVANGSNSNFYAFAVARYNTNGSLDTTFDSDGKTANHLSTQNDRAFAIKIQTDGKIVVGGRAYISNTDNDFGLMRLLSNGSLDTTFGGGDGKVVTQMSTSFDNIQDIEIQTDGKIVAGGFASFTTSLHDFAVARYNSDGSLDTTFAGDGKVTTRLGANNDEMLGIEIQSDGKILGIGATQQSTTDYDIAVVRYISNGSVDTTYGTSGTVETALGTGDDVAFDGVVLSNNKLVVSGFSKSTGDSDFIALKYNTNGTLDTTFSTDGIVQTPISSTQLDASRAIAIDIAGNIISAGQIEDSNSEKDLAMVRYDANGNLDTTFSGDGIQTTSGTGSESAGHSVAIQPDGKIILAGETNQDINPAIAIARYNSNGTLDTSFGTLGKVSTIIDGGPKVNEVAIQSDGKIVVVGSTNNRFMIARYNSNGTPDTTFGTNGVTRTIVIISEDSFAHSVAFQSDGKIIVGGYTQTATSPDFAIVRYNQNGTLDASFDADGKVIISIGGSDYCYSIATLPNDKIVAVGNVHNGINYDFGIARLNPDGSLDTSFSFDGKTTIPIGSNDDQVTDTALQSNGKIVVGGFSNNGLDNDFALVRLNTDGTLDTSFSNDGIVTTPIRNGSRDGLNKIKIQSNGKIVSAGFTDNNAGESDLVITRHNSDGSLDSTSFAENHLNLFGTGGIATTDVNNLESYFGIAIQSDGKIVAGGVSDNYFIVARYQNALAPTAATASINGRVTTASGRSIRNVSLMLTETTTGETKQTLTNPFGYYRFQDLEVGRSYVLSVKSKRFTFAEPSRVITLDEDLTGEDFVSERK
jgi:uncharacterized delta-60 repeat protein